MKICSFIALTLWFLILPHAQAKTLIAENGKALFPIVISADASETTKQNAETLAKYLEKITGAPFAITQGDGSEGIVFGPAADFSQLPKKPDFDPSDPLRTEEYLLFSHDRGLELVGATDLGAQNALWDFLHRLGYRQFFPGDVWEIFPSLPRVEVAYDTFQKPDYHMRSVWSSGGIYKERAELFDDWRRKNRMQSGMQINAGHSYESILSKNKEFFEEHPDYLTEGKKPKLWRPEVREFFVEQYLKRKQESPSSKSISVDPSDGGGWDESAESKQFGSVSNQVITLANETVDALQKEYPGTQVGLYAYNYHSEPPTIRVHPHISVLVATWFRQTRMSLSDQIKGWAKQGATIGIRDYLSYAAMDYDIPSRAMGTQAIDDFVKKWRNYHAWGARYYSGEAQDNWGINGLLYYASARSLWDTKEDVSAKGILEDFLEKSFGPVKDTIRPYYETLAHRPPSDEDLVHRLYSYIADARKQTQDPAILRRLNDLTLYVRYLELNNRFSDTEGGAKITAAKEMFTHLYRARMHSVDHARGIIRDLSGRNPVIRGIRDAEMAKTGKNALRAGIPPWSPDAAPYTDEEIVAMIEEGLANNALFDFKVQSYSQDLVPAGALVAYEPEPEKITQFNGARGKALYYTWAPKENTTWNLALDIDQRKTEEPVRITVELWADAEAEEAPVDTKTLEIKPGTEAAFQLTSPHTGLHRLIVLGMQRIKSTSDKLKLDEKHPWTLSTAREEPFLTDISGGMFTLYFFVPKGTEVLAARAGGARGRIVDPDGQTIYNVNNDKLIRIEIPKGMDGLLWKLASWRGPVQLLSVPPDLAASPKNLLLPKEVVEAETK